MKIEEGKSYKTRDGRKVGPMRLGEGCFAGDIEGGEGGKVFQSDGTHGSGHVKRIRDHDLISEWTEEGPIRTITRRFIKDGIYDGINISDHRDGSVKVRMHMGDEGRRYTKAELDRALLILSQLAEFLDEDKGDE